MSTYEIIEPTTDVSESISMLFPTGFYFKAPITGHTLITVDQATEDPLTHDWLFKIYNEHIKIQLYIKAGYYKKIRLWRS